MNKKDTINEINEYDVKVEILIPTTITYKVKAKSPEEAIHEIEKFGVRQVSRIHHYNKKGLKLSVRVYLPGSSTLKYSRTFRTL